MRNLALAFLMLVLAPIELRAEKKCEVWFMIQDDQPLLDSNRSFIRACSDSGSRKLEISNSDRETHARSVTANELGRLRTQVQEALTSLRKAKKAADCLHQGIIRSDFWGKEERLRFCPASIPVEISFLKDLATHIKQSAP